MNQILSVSTNIGFAFLGMSAMSLMLGFAMFDKGLLALGNLHLLCALPLLFGVQRCITFLLAVKNAKVTLALVSGIAINLCLGWPVIGMIVQLSGLYYLLANYVAFATQSIFLSFSQLKNIIINIVTSYL